MDSRVVINARFSTRQRTGVERFAVEVSRRLGPSVRLARPGPGVQGVRGHLWEQFWLPRLLGRDDLLWSPANTGPVRVARQVVTIHDLSPIDHPDWFKTGFRRWYQFLIPRLAEIVQKITTDSEFSKHRLVEVCGVPGEKVVVVPGAVDHEFFKPAGSQDREATRARYDLRGDYVLTLGTLEPRKNLPRLLEAWRLSGLADQAISLVVAGRPSGSAHESTPMETRDRSVRFLGYVPDVYLPPLLSEATLFVFPSLYEGFGLPVLEAMACGAPVLASNTSAVPEVAGDAAALVDPLEPAEMADRIREIAADPSRLDSLREAGLVRAQEFSWEKSASALSEVFESVG